MTNIFKNTVKTLCLCLVIFLPLRTHAKPGGEIIYQHPVDPLEIWMGNVHEGRTARRIFNQPLLAMGLAIQKGDRYILTVAERFVDDELAFALDAYLFDRRRPHATAKNLTQGRYGDILVADISINGDIIFTHDAKKNSPRGIYLIPQRELEKPTPQAELLLPVAASGVDWAPNGKAFAYCTENGIFGFDLSTKTTVKYTHLGCSARFSPDGRHIAYIHTGNPRETKIGVFSLNSWLTRKTIELQEGDGVRYLTWTDDGQYIVYSITEDIKFSYLNFAISLDGFRTTRILQNHLGGVPIFEWTNKVYSVEPTQKLTTRWGALKVDTTPNR